MNDFPIKLDRNGQKRFRILGIPATASWSPRGYWTLKVADVFLAARVKPDNENPDFWDGVDIVQVLGSLVADAKNQLKTNRRNKK